MVDAMVVWPNSVIDGFGIVATAPNKETLLRIPFPSLAKRDFTRAVRELESAVFGR